VSLYVKYRLRGLWIEGCPVVSWTFSLYLEINWKLFQPTNWVCLLFWHWNLLEQHWNMWTCETEKQIWYNSIVFFFRIVPPGIKLQAWLWPFAVPVYCCCTSTLCSCVHGPHSYYFNRWHSALYIRIDYSHFTSLRHNTPAVDTVQQQTPWPESAIELYRPSDLRLSAKLVPTFADRGCHVVSVTDLYGFILDFLDRSRYFFFK
jgi:hypothetical protein